MSLSPQDSDAEQLRRSEEEALTIFGLSMSDLIDVTKAKIAALGLDVVFEQADPGGWHSTYSLYWATVRPRGAAENDQFAPEQAIERSPEEALCRAAVRALINPHRRTDMHA